MQEEKTGYVDAENYRGTEQNLNFRTIILEQVKVCSKLGSVELRSGYYQAVEVSPGIMRQVYIPASDAAFQNAIRILEILIYPRLTQEERLQSAAFQEHEQKIFTYAKDKGKEYWRELYHVNLILTAYLRFRWTISILHRLGYLDDQSVMDYAE